MKTLTHLVFSLLLVIAVLSVQLPQAYAQTENTYSVAILPFASSEKGNLADLGTDVPALLNAYMSVSSLILVERGEIGKALDETAFGISGTVDPATAAKIGYLTGAQVLVTGRIFRVQNDLFIVAKMIGVETGRVYGTSVKIPLKGNIDQAAQQLADNISGTITSKGGTLIAKSSEQANIIATLKKHVEGRSLPIVSVSIEEESLGRDLVDPAAETEIAHILHQLGFTIIDPAASNVRADIEITGEAFSEFGMRKGSLVSSKGRVEIKAVDVKTGKVVNIGRDVAVAVDLSREMAGKAAVAKAAQKLAKSLVEDLVR